MPVLEAAGKIRENGRRGGGLGRRALDVAGLPICLGAEMMNPRMHTEMVLGVIPWALRRARGDGRAVSV